LFSCNSVSCNLRKLNQCLASVAGLIVGDSTQIDFDSFDSMRVRRGSGRARGRQLIADVARGPPVIGGLAQES
jgi:hypothetical protein